MRMSRVWTYEARMSYISQIHWQKQSPVATLSDIEPEENSDDSDQEGIMSTFTTTIDSPNEAEKPMDEEEWLMESKFKKMDEQDDIHTAYPKLYKVFEKHEKLYMLATRKVRKVELEWEELSTKGNEANQTIRALLFENNFQTEKTKKLDVALF